MARLEEGLLDPVDYLVPDLEVLLGHLLVLVYFLNQLLDMPQFFLSFVAGKVNGDLLMHLKQVLVPLFLLSLNLLTILLELRQLAR